MSRTGGACYFTPLHLPPLPGPLPAGDTPDPLYLRERTARVGARFPSPGAARERKAPSALLLDCARLLSFDLVYARARGVEMVLARMGEGFGEGW